MKGEFSLDEDYAICKKVLPKHIASIEKQGFPFFTGQFTLTGNYHYDGTGKRELQLQGRYLAAKISVNGKTANLIMDEKTDVTELLAVGENRIEISVKVSLRNLFGPLHSDKNYVYPCFFTFRGEWGNGMPAEYLEKYVLSSIGIDSIKICSFQ